MRRSTYMNQQWPYRGYVLFQSSIKTINFTVNCKNFRKISCKYPFISESRKILQEQEAQIHLFKASQQQRPLSFFCPENNPFENSVVLIRSKVKRQSIWVINNFRPCFLYQITFHKRPCRIAAPSPITAVVEIINKRPGWLFGHLR